MIIDIKSVLSTIKNAKTIKALDDIKVEYLGKKGKLSSSMSELKDASIEEKKRIGKYINDIKTSIIEALENKKTELEEKEFQATLLSEKIDVTLDAKPGKVGKIHPITKVTEEIFNILKSFSFKFVTGPEIETDFFNFTALNIPKFHPARQMHDTFYLKDSDKMLRTHTSPVQIHQMVNHTPPIKVFTCGTVYRNDYDATHTPMFHQLEVLYVDKDVTFTNMKWFCMEFCKAFFETDKIKIRLRPSYFPFTEPSAELDVAYKKGDDGQFIIGDGDDWLEIVGCGMVHPNVIKNCDINPNVYQGFAFGFGIERLASLKYGIPDLRGYFDYNAKWMDCFGFNPL